jgi:hypothetical protein
MKAIETFEPSYVLTSLCAWPFLYDIECCFLAMRGKFCHILGIRGKVSRSTLAEASEKRDWRIYSYFAQILIHEARQSYAADDFRLELQEAVYALDATIIDLCLSVFPRV